MAFLKRVRQVLPYTAAILILVAVYRFTRPVLFYIPGDCVCTDYSDRVDSFAVLNPLRNRAPERAADRFFEDVRSHRRSTYAEPDLATEMASSSNGFSGWQLAFREDRHGIVRLYYRVDNSGLKDPGVYGGEGMLEMERNGGNWKAVKFDATY